MAGSFPLFGGTCFVVYTFLLLVNYLIRSVFALLVGSKGKANLPMLQTVVSFSVRALVKDLTIQALSKNSCTHLLTKTVCFLY